MKKTAKLLWSIAFVLALLILGATLADKKYLKDNVIRLHVRAHSDSAADQQEKLAVRDELLKCIPESAKNLSTSQEAMSYYRSHLESFENRINAFLSENGSNHKARVYLREEAFDYRNYGSFSLPAGVYDSLVVEIGSGEGKNWWCVVFPTLCLQDFYTAAASVDMNTDIQNTLTGKDGYQIRFFILECIGKIENLFYNP